MALHQAFPLVHFYQRSLYCFSRMSMEYSLRSQVGVSSCGWVERVLDWEICGLGPIPGGVTVGNFFLLTYAQKEVSHS